jgi:hypothetical protein
MAMIFGFGAGKRRRSIADALFFFEADDDNGARRHWFRQGGAVASREPAARQY